MMGGKEFNFCNKFFVVNDIVLACGQPQRFNLHPLDTFYTHAHGVHSKFVVLEEFWDVDDEFQAQGHCPRKADFSHRRSPIFMEKSNKDEDGESISWVDKYVRYMIHSSTHTSISASSIRNEIWEKEFSLLVQQEELEAFLGVRDDLLNAPFPTAT